MVCDVLGGRHFVIDLSFSALGLVMILCDNDFALGRSFYFAVMWHISVTSYADVSHKKYVFTWYAIVIRNIYICSWKSCPKK